VYSSIVNFNYTASDDLDNSIECNLTVNGIVENWTYAENNNNTIIPVSFVQGGLKYWNVSCIDDAGNWNISETYNFTCSVYDLDGLSNITMYNNFNGTWVSNGTVVVSGILSLSLSFIL